MLPAPLAVTEAAVTGPVIELVHRYVVADRLAVGVKFKASSLQIVNAKLAAEFVMTGTGSMVILTGNVGPGHPLADGVMV